MKRVVVTADTCWGAPRLEGTRIPTREIAGRFRAGDSISDILRDFDSLTTREVEEALRYELLTPAGRRLYHRGIASRPAGGAS